MEGMKVNQRTISNPFQTKHIQRLVNIQNLRIQIENIDLTNVTMTEINKSPVKNN